MYGRSLGKYMRDFFKKFRYFHKALKMMPAQHSLRGNLSFYPPCPGLLALASIQIFCHFGHRISYIFKKFFKCTSKQCDQTFFFLSELAWRGLNSAKIARPQRKLGMFLCCCPTKNFTRPKVLKICPVWSHCMESVAFFIYFFVSSPYNL